MKTTNVGFSKYMQMVPKPLDLKDLLHRISLLTQLINYIRIDIYYGEKRNLRGTLQEYEDLFDYMLLHLQKFHNHEC